MSDEHDKDAREAAAKKARKAAKKMRKAREQLREAKRAMHAARGEAGCAPGSGWRSGTIRIETPDGVKEFEIPEELRRRGKQWARTMSGTMTRDLVAAGLIAAGAAIAAKAHKPTHRDDDGEADDAAGETRDDAADDFGTKANAAAEEIGAKASELGDAIGALANAAVARWLGAAGRTRH